MKRGKDDEKVMGPMFPRLHVNDTEKGGPRAPPRNKMALYEQLSIPSQRFKPGVVPSNTNSPATPASSSQGSGHQRNAYYSHSLPPLTQSTEKQSSLYYDTSASLLSLEQKKCSEEDDFRVPILMQSLVGQDRGSPFLPGPVKTELPKKQLTNINNGPRQITSVRSDPRQEGRKQNEENKGEVSEQAIDAISESVPASKGEVASRQCDPSVSHIPEDYVPSNGSMLPKTGQPLLPEHRANLSINSPVLADAVYNESTRFQSNGDSVPRYDMDPEDQKIHDYSEVCENKTYRSLQTFAADRDDDASEKSVVDSVGLDICPDDVVGIIGQKHFWKARRAIVNQQRVFAVQVFELHRLIKVQRLFAGSPNLLIEDSSYLGKPLKGSSPKKLSIEYAVKVPNVSKHQNDSKKQNYKIECSAENTVGKTSLSSVQNNNQLLSYNQLVANSPAPAASGDHTKGPWCFHQPQGHQWLIPVMSPSEGLVYKPYPGSGTMAPACGGCGPPGSTPTMGTFFPPPFGVPAMHHYHGMVAPPFPSPAGPPGYFPPYGMTVMNQGIAGPPVDPMTHYTSSGMQSQPPWLGSNNSIQHQNSSNTQSLLNEARMDVSKSKGSRDVGMQISTASSPNKVVQENGKGNTSEGSGVLPLFPTAPIVESPTHNTPPPREVDHPTGVIKVVPRNGRSATESVARIFRSIQEERKHYDSV